MSVQGATLTMVNLDSSDPAALTEFYAKVLGWEITYSDEDYGMISNESGTSIGFGRVDNYARPTWPDESSTKRYHLDVTVDDVAAAKGELEALGAVVAEPQPDAERWTVMLDPQGHPFCLMARG